MTSLVKKANISFYGIDDENKNDISSIYYTNINSFNNKYLYHTTSIYNNNQFLNNIETDFNPVVNANDTNIYLLQPDLQNSVYFRRYPPKTWDSLGTEITNTTLNGRPCIRRDFTLTTNNITYGSGTYETYFSSSGGTAISPVYLFNYTMEYQNSITAHFGASQYTAGNYTGTNYLVEATFLGDWVAIKCPESFVLGEYIIHARGGFGNRAPKLYKLYGSTDGINWTVIDDVNVPDISPYNLITEKKIKKPINNSSSYNWYCLTINQNFGDTLLNFIELEFREKERTTTSSSLVNLNFSGNININNINGERPMTYYPILKTNPIAWYKFDDTNLGLDSSGSYTLTGTNLPTRSSTFYIKGVSSASFDGVNDRLINTNAFNINNKSFSVSVWVRRNRIGVSERFLTFGNDYTGYNVLSLGFSSTNRFIFDVPSESSVANSDLTVIGAYFYHIVYTFNSTTRARKAYINGCLDVSQIQTGSFTTVSSVLELGARVSVGYFQGSLDDLRIYEKELSADEVNYLYNSSYIDKSYTIVKRNEVVLNPTVWYKGDLFNNVGADSMGNVNMTNNANVSGIFGLKGDYSMSFSGTNHLSTTAFPRIDNVNFSICFWSYLTSSTTNQIVLSEATSSTTNQSFFMGYSSATQFRVGFWNNSLDYNYANNFERHYWTHWCFTFNLTTDPLSTNRGRLYRNGILVANKDFASAYLGTSQTFYIGLTKQTAGTYFSGFVDDFRLYNNTVLTPEEVYQIYSGGTLSISRTLTSKTSYLNDMTLTNTTVPFIYKDNIKSVDTFNFLIQTSPTTFVPYNTKKFKFTIDNNYKYLKLTKNAKLAIESIYIPNILSKSFLDNKNNNNVILKLKGISNHNNFYSSISGTSVIFSSSVNKNTQGFGVSYTDGNFLKLAVQQFPRLQNDNGILFTNPNPKLFYNFNISPDLINNCEFIFELIYDIGYLTQYTNDINNNNLIAQSLNYNTDRDELENFSVKFIIFDEEYDDKIYDDKTLLNKINKLLLK